MKFFQNRKAVLLTIALAVTIAVGAAGTLAFLTDRTDAVQNIFSPTEVDIQITEEFTGTVKTNVCVHNKSDAEDNDDIKNIDAYVRAMIVVTWQDANGQVLAPSPKLGEDYELTLDLANGWKQSGLYYYYASPIAPGKSTSKLITSAKPLKACGDSNYTLHVEVIAEAVQAEPSDVVAKVWPNKPN